MKKLKKLFALLLVVLMIATVAACGGGGGGGKGGDVSLVLAMIGDGGLKARLDELLAGFTEETGIGVDTVYIGGDWHEYIASIQTMVGGGEQLDAAIMAIEGIELLLSMDMALPIDDFIAANPDIANAIQNDTTPDLLGPFSSNGVTYSFPFSWNNVVMHINTQLLEEAGLDMPPANWDKDIFLQYCEALTVEKEGYTQFALAVPDYNFAAEAWLFNNGGQFMNDDFTTSMVNSPQSVELFQLLQDLIHVYGYAPIPEPGVNAIQQLINGQIAMGSWGRWPTANYVASDFTDVAIQWLPNFKQNMPIFGVDGIFVLSNTDYPDETTQLAAWISDKEFQREYLADGNIPASRSLAQETISALGIPKNFQLFYEDVGFDRMRPVSSPPQFAQASQIVSRAMSEIYVNAADVQSTLDKAAEEMDAVLAANR